MLGWHLEELEEVALAGPQGFTDHCSFDLCLVLRKKDVVRNVVNASLAMHHARFELW